jgi:hypothetical protein
MVESREAMLARDPNVSFKAANQARIMVLHKQNVSPSRSHSRSPSPKRNRYLNSGTFRI